MIFYYEITVVVCVFIAYLIYTDPTAAQYFNLIFKELWVNIRRWFFIARMYPRIKYDTWRLKRRADKLSKKVL